MTTNKQRVRHNVVEEQVQNRTNQQNEKPSPPWRAYSYWVLALVHGGVTLALLALGVYVALRFKPMPSSDFIYYWNLAGDMSLYHKGGIIGLLYAPLKAVGMVPYGAALLVNSLFLLAASAALWLGNRVKTSGEWLWLWVQGGLTIALGVFAVLNSGYAGMVNADFPNVALLLVSARCFYEFIREKSTKEKIKEYIENKEKKGNIKAIEDNENIVVKGNNENKKIKKSIAIKEFEAIKTYILHDVMKSKGRWWLLAGTLALYASVALRVKTGLALGIILGFAVIWYFRSLVGNRLVQVVVLAVCLAVLGAAVTEVALRSQSGVPEDVRRQGRLQLYTGLLVTEPGPQCGRWSREAFDKTYEELDLPMSVVLQRHLGSKSPGQVAAIVGCKLSNVLGYDEFSYREMLGFGVVSYRQPVTEEYRFITRMEVWEGRMMKVFKLLVYALLAVCVAGAWKKRVPWGMLPFFIYLAFMLLHAVFEIQARYMPEPLLWAFVTGVLLLGEAAAESRKGRVTST